MRQLDRDRYSDFTAKHFHEVLRRQHNYTLGYTVTAWPFNRRDW